MSLPVGGTWNGGIVDENDFFRVWHFDGSTYTVNAETPYTTQQSFIYPGSGARAFVVNYNLEVGGQTGSSGNARIVLNGSEVPQSNLGLSLGNSYTVGRRRSRTIFIGSDVLAGVGLSKNDSFSINLQLLAGSVSSTYIRNDYFLVTGV